MTDRSEGYKKMMDSAKQVRMTELWDKLSSNIPKTEKNSVLRDIRQLEQQLGLVPVPYNKRGKIEIAG